jgi:hypothetical protein
MNRMRREILTSDARPDGPYYSAPVRRERSPSDTFFASFKRSREFHRTHTLRK